MSRGYTRERYLDIIHNIRDLMPDAAISADVIVGFPGEAMCLYCFPPRPLPSPSHPLFLTLH